MIRLPCVDCGSTDYPKKYRERLRNGKIVKSRSGRCVLCFRENYRIRYERDRENPIRYAKRMIFNKKWQLNNKLKVREYQKEWELKNAEDIRQKKHEYYLKNKDRILARNKIWKDANRKKSSIGNINHYWRKLEQSRINKVINQSRNK